MEFIHKKTDLTRALGGYIYRISYGGLQSQYGFKTQFPRLGMGSIFAFEFSTSENMDLTIVDMKVNANMMSRGF